MNIFVHNGRLNRQDTIEPRTTLTLSESGAPGITEICAEKDWDYFPFPNILLSRSLANLKRDMLVCLYFSIIHPECSWYMTLI